MRDGDIFYRFTLAVANNIGGYGEIYTADVDEQDLPMWYQTNLASIQERKLIVHRMERLIYRPYPSDRKF